MAVIDALDHVDGMILLGDKLDALPRPLLGVVAVAVLIGGGSSSGNAGLISGPLLSALLGIVIVRFRVIVIGGISVLICVAICLLLLSVVVLVVITTIVGLRLLPGSTTELRSGTLGRGLLVPVRPLVVDGGDVDAQPLGEGGSHLEELAGIRAAAVLLPEAAEDLTKDEVHHADLGVLVVFVVVHVLEAEFLVGPLVVVVVLVLDYTRAEYLKFAARTDIPEHEIDDGEEEEELEEGSDEDEGSDEEFGLEDMDDDEDDEDAQVGMMNLIFGQILRRFREENGRGPDTRELLEMRSALAERLGVDVPPVDDEGSDWDKKAPPFASPGPKLGGTPRKQPQPDGGDDDGDDDDEDNDGEEKKADGEPDEEDKDEDEDAEQNDDDTSEKRGEKRTGDEAGVTAGTPATDEDSDGDNSEERARKRVKFVPKEDHTVHVVERIDHGHSDDDDESSDEDYVEDGAGADGAEEEQEGDARVELEL